VTNLTIGGAAVPPPPPPPADADYSFVVTLLVIMVRSPHWRHTTQRRT
jgi:hypothetical protein